MKVVFSQAAQDDLIDIALHIAQESPAQAARFVDELESHCRKLRDMPEIGSPRPEPADGLRVLTHGRYLAFYRVGATVVRIVRSLHGARDIGQDDVAADPRE